MQMVERVPNKKLYKNPEIVEKLTDVHLTSHRGCKQITLDERRKIIIRIIIRILVEVSIILLTIFENFIIK